ncbi:MAG: SUMF1/EgtB/PvdO family nonheme iron enzyme [Candidatus Wallbacteria bacterium]|nr:SUMF1/EgtB/PvdO family nonheme iron enzyme [Candidatus Wallbacteria bacterium]
MRRLGQLFLLGVATAWGAAVDAAPPAGESAPAAPQGMTATGKNGQGYWCFRNDRDKSLLILVPGGTFRMGRDDGPANEKPAHEVTLSPYLISKYEVTWGQYLQFCEQTGRKKPERTEWATNKHPVANVTWGDALSYCEWAGLRLPTEAEWELAARGSECRSYPWGEDDPAGSGYCKYGEQRCYLKESDKHPRSVGSYPKGASPVGALDLAGNVAEWCRDRYDSGAYAARQGNGPVKDPSGPERGDYRVVRGGAWCYDQEKLRGSTRFLFDPDRPFAGIGFRAARSYP